MRETSIKSKINERKGQWIDLKHSFAPCPVCKRGTISIESFKMEWYCESCGSKWNISKKMIHRGKILKLKIVNNTTV